MRALDDDTFDRIATLMRDAIGVSFSRAKKALVASRLAHRIQHLGLGGYDEYLARIDESAAGGEFQIAVDLLTTNETYFFREPEHFELLEHALIQQRPRSVSVWSAASSFGDEAYSVAMLMADLHAQGRIGHDWSVLGTDISDRVLREAAAGVFPEERLRHVSMQRRKRHCLRGEGHAAGLVQMHPRLREHVRFGQLNLCRPIEPLGPFDAIFLRNVLIYFDPPTKQAVVDRVLQQLKVGGLFFIGMAEGRAPGETPLQALGSGVFRKLAHAGADVR